MIEPRWVVSWALLAIGLNVSIVWSWNDRDCEWCDYVTPITGGLLSALFLLYTLMLCGRGVQRDPPTGWFTLLTAVTCLLLAVSPWFDPQWLFALWGVVIFVAGFGWTYATHDQPRDRATTMYVATMLLTIGAGSLAATFHDVWIASITVAVIAVASWLSYMFSQASEDRKGAASLAMVVVLTATLVPAFLDRRLPLVYIFMALHVLFWVAIIVAVYRERPENYSEV